MSAAPLGPGVYVQELPSDGRSITGVATSVTGFAGRARRGSITEPIRCRSWADFERECGGLWEQSELGYSVYQFFLNGGAIAIVTRVVDASTSPATTSPATTTIAGTGSGALTLAAADPGDWGNDLRVTVDHSTPNADTFHLTVDEIDPAIETAAGDYERAVIATESFPEVSVDPLSSCYVETILEQRSSLARATALPVGRPVEVDKQAFLSGNDGDATQITDGDYEVAIDQFALADIVNIVCVPPLDRDTETTLATWSYAQAWCKNHRAMLLVDPPSAWRDSQDAADLASGYDTYRSPNSAFYFPRILSADSVQQNMPRPFAPSGAVAGVMARIDAARGVWKAPAGIEAKLQGVSGFEFELTHRDSEILNPRGVNALRNLGPSGPTVWGARTGGGDDVIASEWKYIPVRRLALYIEESLFRGTSWAVFEPNDEPLWSQFRLSIGAFLHQLFRQGAFQGGSPREAYFVKCDSETTSRSDIDKGIVNVLIGFAPLKPAEFVIIKLQQKAGEAEQ